MKKHLLYTATADEKYLVLALAPNSHKAAQGRPDHI